MRYLYGDSAHFPLAYNFLATVDTFVTCAARAAARQVEILETRARLAEEEAARKRELEQLEAFHRDAVRPFRGAAERRNEPLVADFAAQMIALGAQRVEDAHRAAAATTERDAAAARADADRMRAEIRGELESALKAVRLPVQSANFSLQLVEGGRYEVSAVFAHADGIASAFTLAAANVPAWTAPRKVAEFAHEIDVQVGLRKSWIKRTMQPEVVRLDEFVIGACELDDDDFTVRLRKRADQRDALVCALHRRDAELLGEVQRPVDDEGAELTPPAPMEPGDRAHLEQLWQLLRAALTELLPHKEKMLALELDGQDVLEQDLALELITRIVRHLAPTVAEIARRSPTPSELSLKHEVESGRREEVYLRRDDLLAKLTPLPPRARALFAPLRLGGDELVAVAAAVIVAAPPIAPRSPSVAPPAPARPASSDETLSDADIVLDES